MTENDCRLAIWYLFIYFSLSFFFSLSISLHCSNTIALFIPKKPNYPLKKMSILQEYSHSIIGKSFRHRPLGYSISFLFLFFPPFYFPNSCDRRMVCLHVWFGNFFCCVCLCYYDWAGNFRATSRVERHAEMLCDVYETGWKESNQKPKAIRNAGEAGLLGSYFLFIFITHVSLYIYICGGATLVSASRCIFPLSVRRTG